MLHLFAAKIRDFIISQNQFYFMEIPKSKSKQRELLDEGTHPAICIGVVDFGTQPGSQQFPDPRRQCQVDFQAVNEQTEDGKAMTIYKRFTFSSSEKSNLVKTIKAWLGLKDLDGFDMDDLLGKAALITVAHSEGGDVTYANITNISAVPKGTKVRKATEPLRSFFMAEGEPLDKGSFDELPEWMQNKIAESPEYAEVSAPRHKKTKPVAAKNGKAKR